MLTIAARHEGNAAHIYGNSRFLATIAVIVLAISIFLIKQTYLSSYNINFRYFYILGASCAIDFVYLAFRSGNPTSSLVKIPEPPPPVVVSVSSSSSTTSTALSSLSSLPSSSSTTPAPSGDPPYLIKKLSTIGVCICSRTQVSSTNYREIAPSGVDSFFTRTTGWKEWSIPEEDLREIYANSSLCRLFLPKFIDMGNVEIVRSCLHHGSIVRRSWKIGREQWGEFLELINDYYLRDIEYRIIDAIHPRVPLDIFNLLYAEYFSVIKLREDTARLIDESLISRDADKNQLFGMGKAILEAAQEANRGDIIGTMMDLYPSEADEVYRLGAHLSESVIKYADRVRVTDHISRSQAVLFEGVQQCLVRSFASPEEQWGHFVRLYDACVKHNVEKELDRQLLQVALNLCHTNSRKPNNRVVQFLVAQPDFQTGWLDAAIVATQQRLDLLTKQKAEQEALFTKMRLAIGAPEGTAWERELWFEKKKTDGEERTLLGKIKQDLAQLERQGWFLSQIVSEILTLPGQLKDYQDYKARIEQAVKEETATAL